MLASFSCWSISGGFRFLLVDFCWLLFCVGLVRVRLCFMLVGQQIFLMGQRDIWCCLEGPTRFPEFLGAAKEFVGGPNKSSTGKKMLDLVFSLGFFC